GHHDERRYWGGEYTWTGQYFLVYRPLLRLRNCRRRGPGAPRIRASETPAARASRTLTPARIARPPYTRHRQYHHQSDISGLGMRRGLRSASDTQWRLRRSLQGRTMLCKRVVRVVLRSVLTLVCRSWSISWLRYSFMVPSRPLDAA